MENLTFAQATANVATANENFAALTAKCENMAAALATLRGERNIAENTLRTAKATAKALAPAGGTTAKEKTESNKVVANGVTQPRPGTNRAEVWAQCAVVHENGMALTVANVAAQLPHLRRGPVRNGLKAWAAFNGIALPAAENS